MGNCFLGCRRQNDDNRNSDNCETVSTVQFNTAVPAMNQADQDLSSK